MIIDKNIPPPVIGDRSKVGRPSDAHYRVLGIGQSWFSVNKPNLWYARKVTGFTFCQRKVVEDGVTGYRTWRIA